MIVRRLKTFLAQLSQRIARAVATLRAQWSGQRARTAATMPQAGSAAPPRAPIAPYRPGSNWLEDARRLRGRPTPRPKITRPANEMFRQVLRDPHWTSAFEAGRQTRPLRPSHPLSEAPERPGSQTSQPAPHRPVAPSSSTPDDSAEAQRRLLLMRELVRRGLYNEGFKPGDIPEQYRMRPQAPDAPPDV